MLEFNKSFADIGLDVKVADEFTNERVTALMTASRISCVSAPTGTSSQRLPPRKP
jgi:hypothetical protein